MDFFGSGGGMIVVPTLVYILKLDEKKARGTAIFSILPMVIASSMFYMKSGNIDWGIGIKCAIGGIVGGYIGAKLLNILPDKYLKMFFAAFLLFMGVRMML